MSQLEDIFEMQLKALKLNGYEREVKFHPTRRWRFDFLFSHCKLAIELHGAIFTQGRHARGAGIEGDMEKINAAQELGYDVLCFSAGMVKSGEAVNQVERMLKARQ
jgi:very-short-patch-repair endonuclease